MDAVLTLLRRYLKAAWRRRWLGVAITWVFCLIGWGVVAMLPNYYESSARLYVNTDAVLTPLLKGLAADTSPAGRFKVLQGTLVSRPNLETLISKTDLNLTVNGPVERDALIQKLAKNIGIGTRRGDPQGVITITYDDKDPKLAQSVVQTLLTIFIENTTGGNRQEMENARAFLQRQIASYQDQLQAAEKRRADFRTKYPWLVIAHANGDEGAGPDPSENVRTKIAQVEGEIQDKQTLVDSMEKELAGGPKSPLGSPTSGLPSPELEKAEQKLAMLRLRYTETFPDVVLAQQEVQALKASPSRATAARNAGGNTAREQVQIKLVESKGQIAALTRQLAALKDYSAKLEMVQRERPGLIAEYQNMTRDYAILRKNYDELVSRLQSANIGQAADTQANKVQVRIIDPPLLPRIPSAPNRILFVSGVLIVGIGAGLGIPILLSQLDRSFWVVEDLRSLGLPVLGGISMLTKVPMRQRYIGLAAFSTAVIVLVAIYGGLMLRILHATAIA